MGRTRTQPTQCRAPDCDGESHARGLCTKHQFRWRAAGQPDLEEWLAAGAPTAKHWKGRTRRGEPTTPKPDATPIGQKPPPAPSPQSLTPHHQVLRMLLNRHVKVLREMGDSDLTIDATPEVMLARVALGDLTLVTTV